MSNNYLEQLDEVHIDVLREIGNIGSGNAATALSCMLNATIDIDVPVVRILDINDAVNTLGGPENIAVGILSKLSGDINGLMMLIVHQEFIQKIINTLLGSQQTDNSDILQYELSELEKSAITEIGNILISAYVNSISTLSGLNMKMSVPAISVDMVGAILSVPAIEMGDVSESVIFIQDAFYTPEQDFGANMLLVPDIASLKQIMSRLGIE